MDIHLIVGLSIPILFLVFTGCSKSLVRKGFSWSNFYLGIDATLAAIASAGINFVDTVHSMENQSSAVNVDFGNKACYTLICILCGLGALYLTLMLHQRWEFLDGVDALSPKHVHRQKIARGIWLGGISNLTGALVMGVYIYFKIRKMV